MFCRPFKATMSIHACIRRQKWSQLYNEQETAYDHSLITCRYCEQGVEININPDCNLDRDFHILIEKQLKVIHDRGWIFKETIPLATLYDTYNYTQMKIDRRKTDGKEDTVAKGTWQERISRFVTKHRNITGAKQNVSKPIRIKLNPKSRLRIKNGKNRRSRGGDTPHS